MIKRFWDFLGKQVGTAARVALTALAIVIVVGVAAAGYWLTRTDYQVLFANLSPADASAMTTELDRLKIAYVVSGQGNDAGGNASTILVDRADVYKTRIKLMGTDIPLHGAIGFELFNSSDLGMTDFAQKINYQRALQGELTRTILSLAEIGDARVLLALPDQGLFKQSANRPKASVTLILKPGASLRAEQVTGIQRLVSAAVPGIVAQDVTIVDQRGVALTRASGDAGGDVDGGANASRLDLRKDTESYLSHKATAVLEQALGQGQALASVDVTLNMDRVQSNTDEVVSAPGRPGTVPTGVIARERETTHAMGPPLGGNSAGGAGDAGGGSNQREVEYALGHRVEQVISQPGSIRRIEVAVVIKKVLPSAQLDQLRRMVAASVGASLERGDAVVIQTMDGIGGAEPAGSALSSSGAQVPRAPNPSRDSVARAGTRTGTADEWLPSRAQWLGGAGLAGIIAVLVVLLRRSASAARSAPASLTDAQRLEALAKVQAWMQVLPGERWSSDTMNGTVGRVRTGGVAR